MFNFILCFCPHTANHFAVLSQRTSDTQSIHIHLFGLVYFMSGVTHIETDVLFCSKLMFANGKIVVCVLI